MSYRPYFICALAFLAVLFFSASHLYALEKEEILVVANRYARSSIDLAKYYMEKRALPEENLLKLWTTDKEDCSREEYNTEVAEPIRKFLREKRVAGKRFRCLVLMYGMPLRVAPTAPTKDGQEKLERLKKEKETFFKQTNAKNATAKEKETAKIELDRVEKEIKEISKPDERSSVDSELSLVQAEKYELNGWTPNPLFAGFQGKKFEIDRDLVLLVSRLDGPDEKTVRRVIDDSLTVEATGLQGTAYFDARWSDPGNKEVSGYTLYDRSIHRAAEIVKKSGKMPVVLNEKDALFQAGEAPGAALYCGWYSLGRYVDAFTWKQGAVGYHIASAEATTLKSKDSTVWCKVMLEKGVAATIGPVSEPYVQAFPAPEIFFAALLSGDLTLAESTFISMPFVSWQMVLIGDPLYRPFRKKL